MVHYESSCGFCLLSGLVLTPAFSDLFFDPSLPDNISFFAPNQAVNIAKWSEDVSGAANPGTDLFCSSPVLEMNGAEAFEPKHDTASVYSMDSAYQSQTGTGRRGASLAEGLQTLTPQDNRSRVSSQFLGSDMYSPTLSSDNYAGFQEQQPDMSHVQLPSAGAPLETGDHSFAFANYTTGQDYSHFTATTISRYQPSSTIDAQFQWGNADSQYRMVDPYNFNAYPKSSQSFDSALYQSHDNSELMFNPPAVPQRQLSNASSMRPAAIRTSSSFSSSQQGARRPSSNNHDYTSYVMSPTSAVSVHPPLTGQQDLHERHHPVEEREIKDDATLMLPHPQSVNDDEEPLSPADAAEAKNMEEEQGKIARSHPLYQAQPDEAGKYHCPQEGKSGCNHKPTTLKCNYDKYVDSHLKPFRCNKKVCVGVQFSSTACLLRHEREAHGMHGHGSRPHLCHFGDCERSVPGNGFPRRYNLFDHMKRVHDYTGPTEPSPPVQPARVGGKRRMTAHKRKSTADEAGEKRQKVAKLTAQQQLMQQRERLQGEFLKKKDDIIRILSNLGGPNELGDDIQLTKEVVGLHEISTKYKGLGG
ncbi:hypothetical protein K491DRAFT_737769 [Lophiostoma macrostomum CBS 122681]|uniref:C2H2-type domain-containing protein n=1 Tax=Lophiostoma macrostomum CBS 122681 TaxID=1314788 RepID=A0A6A6TF47_9PLEO|nr:hypothetical protein K491DRAFT_737769 [Lophiostoma macrostomum CBS 122681]